MKKIVLGIAAVAMAASMAFADPAFTGVVTEFTGNASVEWGIDLDTNKTGFSNSTYESLKLQLFNAGDKSTSGDGIWAELKIKTKDGADAWKEENAGESIAKAAVDVAKFHIYDFYIGIQSGDVTTGQLDINTALRSAGYWPNPGRWLTDVGPDYTQGIVAGYDNGNIAAAVDFRSKTHYDNDYAVAGEVELKDSNEYVNGLAVKAGGSYAFNTKEYGYSGSVAYKANINDTYYVKPVAGVTGTSSEPTVVGAVLFGWGGTNGYGSVNVPYFGDSISRGMTPGVSVVVKKQIASGTATTIVPSFYLGDLVPNLRAAAYGEIVVAEGADAAMAFAAGVAYDVKADDITITPKAGARYLNKNYTAGNAPASNDYSGAPDQFFGGIPTGADYLDVTAGVDVAGIINNTTFSLTWVSGNLLDNGLGTVNVGAKISF